MYRHPYWLIFFGVIIVCVIGYTFYTGSILYHYNRFDRQVPTTWIDWSVFEINEEKFALQADYQFSFKNNLYQGHTRWKENYLNRWAAEEAMDKLKKQSFSVWIDSAHPNYSTLQKIFPIKQCISTIVLWLLTLYFFYVGQYASHYYR